jgi:hypothetical protein
MKAVMRRHCMKNLLIFGAIMGGAVILGLLAAFTGQRTPPPEDGDRPASDGHRAWKVLKVIGLALLWTVGLPIALIWLVLVNLAASSGSKRR